MTDYIIPSNNWNKLVIWGIGIMNNSDTNFTVANYKNFIQGPDDEICDTPSTTMVFPQRSCGPISINTTLNCKVVQGASGICIECKSGYDLKFQFTNGKRVELSCVTACPSGKSIKDGVCESCKELSLDGNSHCKTCNFVGGKIRCESCEYPYKWDNEAGKCLLNCQNIDT